MTIEQVKNKWSGIQTCWKEGCYFFTLLTILDELGIQYDMHAITRFAIDNNYIKADGYVLEPLLFLKVATGKRFTMKVVQTLPDNIADNQFTIEKWYNAATGYTHFKRRFVDTLIDSLTVKNGKLSCYYIFTCED